jgi:hypothetical protein
MCLTPRQPRERSRANAELVQGSPRRRRRLRARLAEVTSRRFGARRLAAKIAGRRRQPGKLVMCRRPLGYNGVGAKCAMRSPAVRARPTSTFATMAPSTHPRLLMRAATEPRPLSALRRYLIPASVRLSMVQAITAATDRGRAATSSSSASGASPTSSGPLVRTPEPRWQCRPAPACGVARGCGRHWIRR